MATSTTTKNSNARKKYERKTKYNQKKKTFSFELLELFNFFFVLFGSLLYSMFFILKVCFHFHTFFIRCLFSYFSHTKSIRMETISFHLSLWQSSHESSHWKAIWNCISSSSKSSTTINSIKSTFGKRYCGFSVYFFLFRFDFCNILLDAKWASARINSKVKKKQDWKNFHCANTYRSFVIFRR